MSMEVRPHFAPRFALRLAIRELRHGFRRVGVYMASITLGVAALVSIHSFREDVARSVQEEADVLMGANARLSDDQRVLKLAAGLMAQAVVLSRAVTEGHQRLQLETTRLQKALAPEPTTTFIRP